MKELASKSPISSSTFSFKLSFGDYLKESPYDSNSLEEIADQIQIRKENDNSNFSKVPFGVKFMRDVNLSTNKNKTDNFNNNLKCNLMKEQLLSDISNTNDKNPNNNLRGKQNLLEVEMMPLKKKI